MSGALRGLARRVVRPRLQCHAALLPHFFGKCGFEVGGPSVVFGSNRLFPIYPFATRIDNCQFSEHTVWHGKVEVGETYAFDRRRRPGRQYIGEASSLGFISSNSYDFVLSAHMVEHLANPLKALVEWRRILKVGGLVVLVSPHKDGTFDHRRPVTTLAHLQRDFEQDTSEADMTHLSEVLQLHDLYRDPGAVDHSLFKERSERNPENRCLHHHVFDTELTVEMVHHAGLEILAVEPVRHYHIFVVAQKVCSKPHNEEFRGARAHYRRSSPFPTDREVRTD